MDRLILPGLFDCILCDKRHKKGRDCALSGAILNRYYKGSLKHCLWIVVCRVSRLRMSEVLVAYEA